MYQTFSIAFTTIISVLCMILAGVVLRRFGRVAVAADREIVRLMIDILFPCLIFRRIILTDAFDDVQNLYLPPLIGFAMTALGILIGWTVTKLPNCWTGLTSTDQKRTFAACVALLNYGYVPIPLLDAMFPNDTRIDGAFFPMFLGQEVSLWTIMFFTMLGKFDRTSIRRIINGPIIIILVAVPLNVACHHCPPLHAWLLPVFNFLLDERCGPVTMISNAAIPLALLMIGLTICELIDPKAVRQRIRQLAKIAFWSCMVRLFVLPVLFIAAAVLLPVNLEIKRVMVIYAAMASAVLPIALSKHYGGNTETAFDTVMSNTLLSLITSPLWIAAGLYWIR